MKLSGAGGSVENNLQTTFMLGFFLVMFQVHELLDQSLFINGVVEISLQMNPKNAALRVRLKIGDTHTY